jgi:cytochrome c-type biogenesis protein CcmF
MVLAHLGVAVTALGIALTTTYSTERDVRLAPGESVTLGPRTYLFEGVAPLEGPNYVADQGTVRVFQNGQPIAVLHPEKRRYLARQMVMTEADIDPGFFRDLYVALGEPLGEGAWALRVHDKPFVRWVWFGGVLMMFGGLMAAFDRRYRRLKLRDQAALAGALAS